MRIQSLYIPYRLNGLNELIAEARCHWKKGAEEKKHQDDLVMWAVKENRIKPISGPFKMTIHFSEPNEKRDPDNIVCAKKYILDGLKKMGIIVDDSQKYVKGWTESWGLATKEKPIGVHIKLIEER